MNISEMKKKETSDLPMINGICRQMKSANWKDKEKQSVLKEYLNLMLFKPLIDCKMKTKLALFSPFLSFFLGGGERNGVGQWLRCVSAKDM